MLLNVKHSPCKGSNSGVSQESTLEFLLFLIYTNILPHGSSSNCKLFADDASLFTVGHNVNVSSFELNSNPAKSSEWAFQLKMSFNPDPTKPAEEAILSRKLQKIFIHQ